MSNSHALLQKTTGAASAPSTPFPFSRCRSRKSATGWNVNSHNLSFQHLAIALSKRPYYSQKTQTPCFPHSLSFPVSFPSPFLFCSPFPFLFPFPDVATTSWNVNSRELSFQQLAAGPSTASLEIDRASGGATAKWRSETRQKNEN